jgi:hypothetical protein
MLRDGVLRGYMEDEFEKLIRSDRARKAEDEEVSEHFQELYIENQ